MCILCVIQKWSRRVATMLPWLVIPLIGLWALSQLLPPAFRFEITSPRLACVFVLLVTLFWYEVLMPKLSAWRVRRNACLRERRRLEAIELEKLKKTATRRCRNCSTPYRDQNPGGGRFMCLYCGHVSKRPVLDMSVPPGLGLSSSGILKDVVGRGGKMLNGKGWSENGWTHGGQEWLPSEVSSVRSGYWQENRSGTFGGDDNCLVENSYSGGILFASRLLSALSLSIRWLWRKIFRFSSSDDESSSDADQRRMLGKQGENETHSHETRGDKARRKAEEKRQARMEKELLEEEERKQREEVARLVEERRKLRDERVDAEKCRKASPTVKEKDNNKKEAEKKRQERKRDKDKASSSSKNNSDAEELDKRTGKEAERKRELDKNDRLEHQRHVPERFKANSVEKRHGHGVDNNSSSNNSRTSSGGRYFDRMKGTILSSSKAFTDSRFFGKSVNTCTVTKENRPVSSAPTRDPNPPDYVPGKSDTNGEEKNTNRPVVSEPQLSGGPRKSWHHLFSRSSSVPASSSVNAISRPTTKPQEAIQSSQVPDQVSSIRTFDNPISFGLPSPFTTPMYPSGSTTSSLGFPPAAETVLSQAGGNSRDVILEEPELFEDPCYDPDPISLLGPISESLELRSAFETGAGLEKQHVLKKTSCGEVSKPSPIESPLSRSRIADEKPSNNGTWQMWKSPLGQDSLGFVGGSASWLLSSEPIRSNKEDTAYFAPQSRTTSLFAKEDPLLHCDCSRRKDCLENDASSPGTGPNNGAPWSHNAFFPAFSGMESQFSLSPQEESAHKDVAYGISTASTPDHPFEPPCANHWLKKVKKNGEDNGKQFVEKAPYQNQDVQSFW